MPATTTLQPPATTVDDDLARQARPGHGIPSQDPDPAAQQPLSHDESAREVQSVLVGGGVMAGAATGASIGVAVAGPAGVLVGATLGAVAGALGAAAAGSVVHPQALDGSAGATATTTTTAATTTNANNTGHAPDTDPVRLHVEDSGGAGRPVVLIHGWPLSGQAWAPQVDVLRAAGYRVLAYDRRGFGRSDKPASGYDYDVLADDLARVIDAAGLRDLTLVGFSMGGGEVARYITRHGSARLRSVVFAAAVPPCLLQTADNPEGPLTPAAARTMRAALAEDRSAFFHHFTRDFYTAHGVLQVIEAQCDEAVALCEQSAQPAALACMDAFAHTDFRPDLQQLPPTLPTLVLHGDADAIVPLEGSGARTHRALPHSQLVVLPGAPHGLNLSHAEAFNRALLQFLRD